MRLTRIYVDQTLSPGDEILLPEAAANHLVRVLRLKQGDPVIFFNGRGGEYLCTISHADHRKTSISVNEHIACDREPNLKITLVQGISRSDRMDACVQKATELGVSRIIPVKCERSAPLNKQAHHKKRERWRQITVSACEQSGRTTLPAIEQVTLLETALGYLDGMCKLVLETCDGTKLGSLGISDMRECTILVGPEGGFSEPEVELAVNTGFVRTSLGPRILRTETAGPACIAALMALHGDLA